jgi:hypothetical protein
LLATPLPAKQRVNKFKSAYRMVGEHCGRLRRYTERSAGGSTRAYVDTSSENEGEKPSRRKPQVSCSQVNLLRVSRPLRRGREA